MTNLYLIAHKVRGEPAFDIAIKMHVDALDEDWWIIPTSGHRAYPYYWLELDDLKLHNELAIDLVPDMPEDWRDHYEADIDRTIILSHDPGEGKDLLARLGLIRKQEPIRRRV